MGFCFRDQADRVSERALASLAEGTAAHVPLIWRLEVLNVLLVAERRGKLRQSESARFVQLLSALPIVEEEGSRGWGPAEAEAILALSRQYGLSAYDTSYLSLAMRQGLPLATRDRQLGSACSAVGVPLFE